MNIPNLPTDNIYKFSAIFGLIIFIGSIILFQSSDKIIFDAKIRSEISNDKRHTDSVYSDFKLNMYSIRMDFHAKRMKLNPENHIDSNYFFQENAKLEKEFEEHRKASNEYVKSINENYKNDTELAYYEYKQNLYRLISITFAIIGVLLIAWGFKRWYYKHQVYIDAEIKWKGETFVQLLKDAENVRESITEKAEIKTDEFNIEKKPD